MMRPDQADLPRLAHRLFIAERRELFASRGWTTQIPNAPGVYAIWHRESGRPVYIGETADLRSRMIDLGRYHNHTCRRKLAKALGMNGGNPSVLSAEIARTHQLSCLELWLGRVELEEYLLVRWRPFLINSLGQRHLNRYRWVTPDDWPPSFSAE